MEQTCSVYDNSLRFSRTIYGFLALISFLFHNIWIALVTAILMFFGVISIKYNIFYQFHHKFLRALFKDKTEPIQKENQELSFACGMGATFLLAGFFVFRYFRLENLAWILVLLTSILMLLAGIVGVCTASLMYALFKKILKRK